MINSSDNLMDRIRPPWCAKATGDMTLSVLDNAQMRIIRIDMLRYRTMDAGDGGNRLTRAYNDLTVVAACPELLGTSGAAERVGLDLPHPDAGISPMPWTIVRTQKGAKLVSSAGKYIADISWKTCPSDILQASLDLLELSLPMLSQLAADRTTGYRSDAL